MLQFSSEGVRPPRTGTWEMGRREYSSLLSHPAAGLCNCLPNGFQYCNGLQYLIVDALWFDLRRRLEA